ncbi:helix-turn-helix domain-containing protein [Streptomyces tsukubensis]|uniref:Transcriptional regulator n=1 Tax=Streptomyces tsukubensis TaxID=83656 RepID=A0A1V4AD81_9ACTN|nr:helix-turn-helix transcriptional regulator [Streptomyces tsukubensis]OON81449.1 transcriptional regulator [Streptomyces tsukubensis]QFR95422.1 helix-turn-helix domain-containing protein [Streptomyces tsukubensis]
MDERLSAPHPATAEPPLDRRAELSEFLRTRRARLKPADVGLPDHGRHRRVPGLRREELSQLAGVSVAYYTRLEQGNGRNVSAEVLDAIARALRLSEAEHSHLNHLAKPKHHKKKKNARPQRMRPELQRLLDAMTGVPAYVVGHRTDILGWNPLAAAVFCDFAALEPQERNFSRLIFLHPPTRALYRDWDVKAAETVSGLRMYAGCYADDPALSALVGELSVKSEEFRTLWASHDVRDKGYGSKTLTHPLVGEITLSYETLKFPNDPDQSLVAFHAEPGSPSAEALRLLGSWGVDATTAGTSSGL